ncbi:hypothetical protein ACIBTV_25560 [Micromonospora sp. NPDC049366]|uniref:hypothetical protein n=1 Tax=Micromonospora sp. NPDC049366 TaxID=3364271 RepID=UPI0037B1ED11
MDLHKIAATAIARARTNSGMSTPEFDFQIAAHGIGGIHSPLGSEVYEIANAHMPEAVAGADNRMNEREANHRRLWEALQPELQAYAQRCRERRYTGWSDEAQARGARIRYAK